MCFTWNELLAIHEAAVRKKAAEESAEITRLKAELAEAKAAVVRIDDENGALKGKLDAARAERDHYKDEMAKEAMSRGLAHHNDGEIIARLQAALVQVDLQLRELAGDYDRSQLQLDAARGEVERVREKAKAWDTFAKDAPFVDCWALFTKLRAALQPAPVQAQEFDSDAVCNVCGEALGGLPYAVAVGLGPYHKSCPAAAPVQSRSVQRRVAVQKGEPMPSFAPVQAAACLANVPMVANPDDRACACDPIGCTAAACKWSGGHLLSECECGCHTPDPQEKAQKQPAKVQKLMPWEETVALAKKIGDGHGPIDHADAVFLSAAVLYFDAAIKAGTAKLPASWSDVAAHAAGYEKRPTPDPQSKEPGR